MSATVIFPRAFGRCLHFFTTRFALVCLVAVSWLAGASGHAAEPVFYRGININGPSVVIDGNAWEGKDAPDYVNRDKPFENQAIALVPPVDGDKARMIRSSTYTPQGRNLVRLQAVAAGEYSVFLWVWEDNRSETFHLFVNANPVETGFRSGSAGEWRRLGPWRVQVGAEGTIEISSTGGHANFSGIEVWRGWREDSPKVVAAANPEATAAGLDFFESKIRPLLVAQCYECHSAETQKSKGGLRVDNRAGLLQGGDSGPAIIPGDPDKSLLISAVHQTDKDMSMPPKSRLAAHEIAALVEWVRMGAPDPRDGKASPPKRGYDWERERQHWAYSPITKPPVPAVKNSAWAYNEIDTFILAGLEAKGLSPVADAEPRALLRRMTYNLHGVPPTPEEVAAFTAASQADRRAAIAESATRLLGHPRYGERWGRHWLDVVRYADTAGDNSDYPIPQLWQYRNYVIDSFNADVPYQRFVKEQIAGDLMPSRDSAERNRQVIATGYVALSRRFGSVVDRYPVHLTIEDTIDNLARTFLGLSVNCSRCHDHKFDAITQKDYYGIYGIFDSTQYAFPGIELLKTQKHFVPLISPEEIEAKLGPWRAKEKELQGKHDQLAEDRVAKEKRKADLEHEMASAQGEAREKLAADLAALNNEITAVRGKIRGAADAVEKWQKERPMFPDAYAVQDGKPADARVQIKGEPERTGDVVPRKFLEVLGGQQLAEDLGAKTSGRLQLAEWIVDPANPLTARVIVNRVWQYHFGSGLVTTPSDFGKRGLPPSHPELLDWLAARFMADGWSLKALHRLILGSRTYQLACDEESGALAADPENRLHWRFTRHRLDAEQLRDSLLALSGEMDWSPLAEPHPFPPPEKWEFTQHHPFRADYPSKRRSVYLMTARLTASPYFQTFDGPDRNASTPARDSSVTTVQALYFLNDPFMRSQAECAARRLLAHSAEDAQRIERAYALLLQRSPHPEEAERIRAHLAAVRNRLLSAGTSSDALEVQAWASVARALFRSNEFLYID